MGSLEKGINLTAFHQQQWGKTRIFSLVKLLLIFFIGLSVFSLTKINEQHERQHQNNLNQRIQEQRSKISLFEQKISQFQNTSPSHLNEFIDNKIIIKFNEIIQKAPIKTGGISDIRFYYEDETKIKMMGKYEKQQDISLLEKYLEEHGFLVKVETIQTTERTKTEFSLIISLEKSL